MLRKGQSQGKHVRWTNKIIKWDGTSHDNPRHRIAFQHSPSIWSQCMESKCRCEVFCLQARNGFSQGICCHVISRTINEFKRSIVNDKSDEVVAYVNVFCASVVISVSGDGDSWLIVAMKCCGFCKWWENFSNEIAEPDGFFGGMSSGDVFGFSGW